MDNGQVFSFLVVENPLVRHVVPTVGAVEVASRILRGARVLATTDLQPAGKDCEGRAAEQRPEKVLGRGF
jgi:hypothetical protein